MKHVTPVAAKFLIICLCIAGVEAGDLEIFGALILGVVLLTIAFIRDAIVKSFPRIAPPFYVCAFVALLLGFVYYQTQTKLLSKISTPISEGVFYSLLLGIGISVASFFFEVGAAAITLWVYRLSGREAPELDMNVIYGAEILPPPQYQVYSIFPEPIYTNFQPPQDWVYICSNCRCRMPYSNSECWNCGTNHGGGPSGLPPQGVYPMEN